MGCFTLAVRTFFQKGIRLYTDVLYPLSTNNLVNLRHMIDIESMLLSYIL